VDYFQGTARFVDPHAVVAGARRLPARNFLICTGARPALPDVAGLADTPHLTSETIWTLERLPAHLLVLGGGPVGLELAQAFRRLGSAVTLLTRGDRLLGGADPDVSAALAAILADDGVAVRTGVAVERVGSTVAGVAVAAGEETWQGDTLLVATGRAANVDGLFLDRAGIALGSRGIAVDQYLRTSQPHVYACGDVLGGPRFTHYAGWQGYQAVRNALLPGHAAAVRDRVPWTLFTDPEAAQVGLSEPEARARHGDSVRADVLPLERVDRALAEGDRAGFVKVVQRANGELLGAHVVAARAGELIHEYVLALGRGLRTADLAAPIHVYPTYSTAVWQLAAERQMADFLASRLGRLLRRWVRRGQ
jgi:pyruvate/2-oxoglutarate dehydrogenase complex dihydrolipoamide dehydrogenase (E3) component